MPLSFRSENYGNIAFGFFNIESDMLLLENYFFFAHRFCEWMGDLSEKKEIESVKLEPQVDVIENPGDIGDLMGAIHGVRFTGFIGRIYQLFPFPHDPGEFRQNPEGFNTQKMVEEEIKPFSKIKPMPFRFFHDRVGVGPYEFSIPVFHELIRYVWEGGYPRWKDGIRPGYVMGMKKRVEKNSNSFFKGVFASQKI
ncbi:MAG: hypothetical protein A2277_09920 [Desulfobacterales bacterium RIFOXYA12_FULL_46_15]|nr:MAG: hypothetical protein A2097_10615 [Desulfobacula sp. GWF2_41_7]OGR24530.1 MAG: hypothetical protein A2277_09920 [Desulfobacterales bacterium RIFOXYA12_FULL_46_15]